MLGKMYRCAKLDKTAITLEFLRDIAPFKLYWLSDEYLEKRRVVGKSELLDFLNHVAEMKIKAKQEGITFAC